MARTTNSSSQFFLLFCVIINSTLCLAEATEEKTVTAIDNTTIFSSITTPSPLDINSGPKRLKLKLLVVIPLRIPTPDEQDTMSTVTERWDRGLEMLPGAQLAAEAINNDPRLLPGYELEIVSKSVDLCIPLEVSSNLNAYTPFAKGVLENDIVGMLGLFCYKLLRSLSPLAGREEYSLFQLSGTMFPYVRGNRQRYSHLNFAVPSEAAYYETFFTLTRELEWRRLLVIDDSFFNLSLVRNSTQLRQNLNITFLEFSPHIHVLTNEIRRSKNNIIFVSVGPKQTAHLLCGAYDSKLLWPYYGWILQDHKISDLILHAHGNCTTKKITEALRNIILLRYQYEQRDTSRMLVTGSTYESYLRQYLNIINESGGSLQYNQYANIMHDSVWAFALALNQSLDTILQLRYNMTVIDFVNEFGREQLTNSIEDSLRSLSFEGVSGRMQFNNDYDIEALVDITLVHDGAEVIIGYYDQLSKKLSLNRTLLPASDLPPDKLPSTYKKIPLPVTALLIVLVILCLILTTIMFILFIKYRQYLEIKATSPYLSLLMFVGTYLILFSTLMQAILTAVRSPTGTMASATLCGSVISGDIIGINLIFSTLLLRMLRIYRIFTYFGKTGKVWSDKVLIVIVLLIIGGDVALLIIWFVVDPYTVKEKIVYRYMATDDIPYYAISQYCSSDKIELWFSLTFGKVAVLFVIVLFLAIKTRKIQRANFKDTKKVNIYIFLTVMIIATLIPVWFLLKETGHVLGTGIVICISFGSTGLLNQLMLFSPKVIPLVLRSMGFNFGQSLRNRCYSPTIIRRDFSNARTVPTCTVKPMTATSPSPALYKSNV